MPHPVNVGSIELQAQRSTLQDGLTELVLGGMLTVFGLLFFSRAPVASLAILLVFALKPWIERVKARHVYPRIGYVKLAQTKENDPKGIVIAAFVFIAILLGTMGIMGWIMGWDRGFALWLSHVFPSFTGVMMAVGPWSVACRYGLKRAYLLAILFPVGGIALPLTGFATGYTAVAWLTTSLGLLSLVYGAFAFRRFLRTHPIVEGADNVEAGEGPNGAP